MGCASLQRLAGSAAISLSKLCASSGERLPLSASSLSIRSPEITMPHWSAEWRGCCNPAKFQVQRRISTHGRLRLHFEVFFWKRYDATDIPRHIWRRVDNVLGYAA